MRERVSSFIATMTKDKLLAWLFGCGMVFFAIHNQHQPFIKYIFLPQLGMLIVVIMVIVLVVFQRQRFSLGEKKVWAPLALLSACIAISSFVQYFQGLTELNVAFGAVVIGCVWFGVYLMGRRFGSEIFVPFAWASVIGTIGMVWWTMARAGLPSGGIISPTNYDIAAGLIAFGALVGVWKQRWWLVSIALIGVLLTGAEEGLLIIFIVFIAIIWRRDWSRKLLLPAGVMVSVLLILFVSQRLFPLYHLLFFRLDALFGWGVVSSTPSPLIGEDLMTSRFIVIVEAMKQWNWFGYGYTLTDFTYWTVHNVPLVIVQQIGPVAALLWLGITIYCAVRFRWKYIWCALFGMCIFDHYIWTQVAPWWWALVGVVSVSNTKKDMMFKECDETKD